MYVFSALLKTAPCWRVDFSATYYALANDQFTTTLGQHLLHYPRLLQLLTLASLLLEGVGPMLLLCPVGNKWLRIGIPLAYIGFHLGLAATMDLGTFPWVCILYWVAFLPSAVWDALDTIWAHCRERPPWRSGNCQSVHFGGNRNATEGVPYKSRTREPVAVGHGTLATNLVAAFFLGYVVLLNVNRLQHRLASVGPPPLCWLGKAVGLEQYWNMFAPQPFRVACWLRVEGELADGTLVNLYRPDEPLPDAKPARVSSTFSSQYWRRAMLTLYEFDEPAHQTATLRYFAHRWNMSHAADGQVTRMRLILLQEHIPPPNSSPDAVRPIERRVLCEVYAT
jgi:hypothetical protein